MDSVEHKKTILYITIYSILVLVLAWTAPLLGGSPDEPGLGFILLWGTAPMIVALLMRFVTRDWSDSGFKPAIRKNTGWYVVSALIYPIILVLTLVTTVTFSISSVSGFSLGAYLPTTLVALPIFFIFAIFEEVGWRGYLTPKLASLGINRFIAAALLAVVWTLWHVPFLQQLPWVSSSEDLLTFVPRYYLVLFALAIIYGEIISATGSFWPAVLLHAVSNSFGHPLDLDYVTVSEGMEYLGSASTGLITIAFTMLLGIAINRWRLHKSAVAN
jgi:membrane protease YdiL (CAAX protease family)